jgi:hypothetical protein
MSKSYNYVIGECQRLYWEPYPELTKSEHMEEDDEGTKALPEWVKLE